MNFATLIQNLQVTHDTLFTSASKAVNTAMTIRNWLYGYYIVEYEQKGEDRAKYGSRLMKELADNIPVKGISETNLRIFRQFYLTYPAISQALPDVLPEISDTEIHQALPDELRVPDIKAIKAKGAEPKPGLNPARLLQTLSFTHLVELIKIDDPLRRHFMKLNV